MTGYAEFAAQLVEGGIIADPWVAGAPRFRAQAVILSAVDLAAMHRAAEAVAEAYDEAARVLASDPSLLDDFLGLTPCQKLMWAASQPRWHAVARADVFRVQGGGLAVCEVNSDTPTGLAEAVVLAGDDPRDPNVALGSRVDGLLARVAPGARVAAIVYPTEMSEDLALVHLWRTWLERRGVRVVLGSPFNVTEGVRILGEPCDLIVRHYKTDWWGERLPAWVGEEPFADALPLARPLAAVLEAEARGAVTVVNPFGAVVTQNKRCMALMWEHRARFSDAAQRAIEAHVPRTVRLEAMHPAQLAAERVAWVLKSDYGCEGDEVIIGADVTDAVWEEALVRAAPGRWVAQRYFAPEVDASGAAVNHGVFLVAGEACGLYARVQCGATTSEALSAPVRVV